jgi:hypothetical protein
MGIGFLVALYAWDMALEWFVGLMARFTGDGLMRSLERKGLMLPVFSYFLEGLEDGMALAAILSTLTLVFVLMAVSTGEAVRSIQFIWVAMNTGVFYFGICMETQVGKARVLIVIEWT